MRNEPVCFIERRQGYKEKKKVKEPGDGTFIFFFAPEAGVLAGKLRLTGKGTLRGQAVFRGLWGRVPPCRLYTGTINRKMAMEKIKNRI